MTGELGLVFCPTCHRECLTEVPPCPDGHGERCPDRACVECGSALLWDAMLRDITVFEPAPRAPGRRAPRQRRVA